jgi:hypothetical protein
MHGKGGIGMLSNVFLICAVVGGALVGAQLLLSVLAFGGGHGLKLHHRIGGSVSTHRMIPRSTGVKTHLTSNVRGAAGAAKQAAPHTAQNSAAAIHTHWAMAWVLGMLNFQGIVSGITVFGLVGLAANAAKLPGSLSVKLGIVAALVMMSMISGMFSLMTNMDRDGTVDLQLAIGKPATVYLSIPGKNEGQGKITVSLQDRSMELGAVTFQDDPLATGQKVVIVAVLGTDTMLVVAADKYVPEPVA